MNPSNLSQPSTSPGASAPTEEAEARKPIKESVREKVDEAKTSTADMATRAREKGAAFAADTKRQVADKLGGYSSAVHGAAESFQNEDPNIAWFTHRAADRLEGVAEYIRERDFAQLRDDVEGLARRHPAAFIGGMLAAGLVLGSFLKAGRQHEDAEEEWYSDDEYDTGRSGVGGSESVAAGIADERSSYGTAAGEI